MMAQYLGPRPWPSKWRRYHPSSCLGNYVDRSIWSGNFDTSIATRILARCKLLSCMRLIVIDSFQGCRPRNHLVIDSFEGCRPSNSFGSFEFASKLDFNHNLSIDSHLFYYPNPTFSFFSVLMCYLVVIYVCAKTNKSYPFDYSCISFTPVFPFSPPSYPPVSHPLGSERTHRQPTRWTLSRGSRQPSRNRPWPALESQVDPYLFAALQQRCKTHLPFQNHVVFIHNHRDLSIRISCRHSG
jgi:hypothetical protein